MSAPWPSLVPATIAVATCGVGGHATLVVAALRLGATTHTAVFIIGAATLGLLLIGIHNAWDPVTHVVVTGGHADETRTE